MSCNCETLLVAFQQEIETVTWEEVHRRSFKVKKTAGKNIKENRKLFNGLIELEKENLVPESSTGDPDSSVETSPDTSSDSDFSPSTGRKRRRENSSADDSDPSVKTYSDSDSDSSPDRLDIFEILKLL
ncbi:hypothetical protein F8M41_004157 [Gigaspora margarita]|uniref:Uncharacterized protein n=1 Tax=Gigaspora margarita TaxID=4874 RepID=A0A8H3XCN3_GIGMA|nr:hypothetical protein F8M41_004157 [Gigaspora margarita]